MQPLRAVYGDTKLDKLNKMEYSLRTAYHAGPPRFARSKRRYWEGRRPRTWGQIFGKKLSRKIGLDKRPTRFVRPLEGI